MTDDAIAPAPPQPTPEETPHGRNWYTRTPLYLRIVVGLLLGVVLGTVLMLASPTTADGSLAPLADRAAWIRNTMRGLDVTASMLLRLRRPGHFDRNCGLDRDRRGRGSRGISGRGDSGSGGYHLRFLRKR